jgi:5-methylthioadenosine/S-adenosylhomocysteine deaminase
MRSGDAKHVMVDGELLLLDGRYTRVGEMHVTDLIKRAGKHACELGRRAGLLD